MQKSSIIFEGVYYHGHNPTGESVFAGTHVLTCIHACWGAECEGCAESLQELQSLQKKKLTIPFRERENIAE